MDSAEEPKYIETLARRYRVMVEVEQVEPCADERSIGDGAAGVKETLSYFTEFASTSKIPTLPGSPVRTNPAQ